MSIIEIGHYQRWLKHLPMMEKMYTYRQDSLEPREGFAL